MQVSIEDGFDVTLKDVLGLRAVMVQVHFLNYLMSFFYHHDDIAAYLVTSLKCYLSEHRAHIGESAYHVKQGHQVKQFTILVFVIPTPRGQRILRLEVVRCRRVVYDYYIFKISAK